MKQLTKANKMKIMKLIEETDLEEHSIIEGDGIIGDTIDKVKDFFNPYKDYNPTAKRTIQTYGPMKIYKITAFRKPILSVLDKIINFISNNEFDKGKQLSNYDSLFHLGLIVLVGNNNVYYNIVCEKNEVIRIELISDNHIYKQGNLLPIPVNIEISLNDLLQNAQQKMGSKYFTYDGFGTRNEGPNNCQVFAQSLLKYSELLTSESDRWIYQPLDSIIKQIPKSTPAIAKAVTTIGAFISGIKSKITGNGNDGNDGNDDDEYYYMVGGGYIDTIKAFFEGLYKLNKFRNQDKKPNPLTMSDNEYFEKTKQIPKTVSIKPDTLGYQGGAIKTKQMADEFTQQYTNLNKNKPSISDKIKNDEETKKQTRLQKAKEQADNRDKLMQQYAMDNAYVLDDKKALSYMPKSKSELKTLKSLYNKQSDIIAKKAFESTLSNDELKIFNQQKLREKKFLFDKQELAKAEQAKVNQDRTESKIDRDESKIDRDESKIDRIDAQVERVANRGERDRVARKEQKEKDDRADKYFVETHQIYKIKNTKLRDSMERQYNDMFNKMIQNPRKYGSIFTGNKSIKKYDQNTIDTVYAKYGKPEATFDTMINDGLVNLAPKAVGYIPGVGKIAEKGLNMALDATKDKPAENVGLDYNEFEGMGKYDGLRMHAIKVKTTIPLDEALKLAKNITKSNKNLLHRHTQNYHIFRVVPRTKFRPKSFKTKKMLNKDIDIVFGELL